MNKKVIQRIRLSSLVFALSLLTVGGSLTSPVAQAASNLVLNPSFESATSLSSKDALNWREGTDHVRATNKFVSGHWSLRSTLRSGASATRTAVPITVAPNTTYTLSGYIWKEATNPGSGSCLDMSDIDGELQLCTTLTGAWQFLSGTWNSGSNNSLTLRLVTDGDPNGDTWFDDISLMPVGGGAPTSTPGAAPGTVIVAGAGDIACGTGSTGASCKQQATSDLLLSLNPDLVLAFGDTQYESGTLNDFKHSFDPTWGRLKAKLRPAPGNHEYLTSGASGYFDYFNGVGQASGPAGDRSKGYYSYDVGNWHVIAANSNCGNVGGCEVGSAQYTWLQNDLAQDSHPCSLIYMHHPLSSSDTRNFDTNPAYQPLLQLFYDDGGELMLVGHSHFYERFARMDANKNADGNYGFREIVVGTGGRNVYGFGSIRPLSEVRNGASFGVIKLTLAPDQYTWEFVPVAGSSFTDTGAEACHGAHP